LFIVFTGAAAAMGLATSEDLPATVVLVLCLLWFLLPVWLPFLLMRFQDRTR
jgi:hypothetical protein